MTGISIYLLTIVIGVMLIIGIKPWPKSGDECVDSSLSDLEIPESFQFASSEQVGEPFGTVPDISISCAGKKKRSGYKKHKKGFRRSIVTKTEPGLYPSPVTSSQISNVVDALDQGAANSGL